MAQFTDTGVVEGVVLLTVHVLLMTAVHKTVDAQSTCSSVKVRIAGQNVDIVCSRPSGVPPDTNPSSWYRNGDLVAIQDNPIKYTPHTDGSQVTVNELDGVDEGNYSCTYPGGMNVNSDCITVLGNLTELEIRQGNTCPLSGRQLFFNLTLSYTNGGPSGKLIAPQEITLSHTTTAMDIVIFTVSSLCMRTHIISDNTSCTYTPNNAMGVQVSHEYGLPYWIAVTIENTTSALSGIYSATIRYNDVVSNTPYFVSSATNVTLCDILDPPTNGSVQYDGCGVMYSCDNGFELIGANRRNCTPDGWSGTPPSCRQQLTTTKATPYPTSVPSTVPTTVIPTSINNTVTSTQELAEVPLWVIIVIPVAIVLTAVVTVSLIVMGVVIFMWARKKTRKNTIGDIDNEDVRVIPNLDGHEPSNRYSMALPIGDKFELPPKHGNDETVSPV